MLLTVPNLQATTILVFYEYEEYPGVPHTVVEINLDDGSDGVLSHVITQRCYPDNGQMI